MCKRLPLIISQFNSLSGHGFALSYTDHLSFVSSGLEHSQAAIPYEVVDHNIKMKGFVD